MAALPFAGGQAAAIEIVTGSGEGAVSVVSTFDVPVEVSPNGRGQASASFTPYGAFTGGVRVATGDINGDGTPDIITAAGPGGGPRVTGLSGVDESSLVDFFAFDPGFTGGVFVAAGDVDGDNFDDIITSADAGGGPHVIVFSGADGGVLHDFFAFAGTFTGGVSVAAGDVNGDGIDDIITGAGPDAGPGGGPHVKVFDGSSLTELANFFAYDATFTGGVFVAAGDVNGDGRDDIITGAGPGAGPHVRVFSGADGGGVLHDFFAYDPTFTGGVFVGAGDVNGDGIDDIITGAGPGAGPGGGPHVKVFDGSSLTELANFFAYYATFTGGVFVAGVRADRIPEPSSLVMLVIGGIGLAARARRITPKAPGRVA